MDPYSSPDVIRRRLARDRRETLLLRWACVGLVLVSVVAACILDA